MVQNEAKSDAVVNPSPSYYGPELYPRIARRQQRTAPSQILEEDAPASTVIYIRNGDDSFIHGFNTY